MHTPATPAELDAFIIDYDLTIQDADKPLLLRLSQDFMETLRFCSDVDAGIYVKAQCFLIKAISEGFSPDGIAEDKILVEKGLGRSAIVKKWKIDKSLSGTDSMTAIKRLPMVYNLLSPYLCSSDVNTYELVR